MYEVFPQGITTHAIAQYSVETGPLKGLNLLHAAIWSWAWSKTNEYAPLIVREKEVLIRHFIAKGSDLHNVDPCNSITPLLRIVHVVSFKAGFYSRFIGQIVKAWL